ncbi:MAG: C40 family peptidase [Bacteroidetes bacterium]|nr:C40 family peptidase [Bacteroidota bacterium]
MLKRLLFFIIISLSAFVVPAQTPVLPSSSFAMLRAIPGVNRTDLITFAKLFLGTPYRLGGSDPKRGFDCSGIVSYVYKHFNLALPRSSREYKSLGTALKPEEFKVGDVVVFYGNRDRGHIGHVGIICEADGMRSRFIHASSGKAHGVTISSLESQGYKRRFYKCIDVISR